MSNFFSFFIGRWFLNSTKLVHWWISLNTNKGCELEVFQSFFRSKPPFFCTLLYDLSFRLAQNPSTHPLIDWSQPTESPGGRSVGEKRKIGVCVLLFPSLQGPQGLAASLKWDVVFCRRSFQPSFLGHWDPLTVPSLYSLKSMGGNSMRCSTIPCGFFILYSHFCKLPLN